MQSTIFSPNAPFFWFILDSTIFAAETATSRPKKFALQRL